MFKAYEVLLPVPVPELTYLAPLNGEVPVAGARIVVPWQNGLRIGLVRGEAGEIRDHELRHAVAVLDTEPYVAPAFVAQIIASAAALGVPSGAYLGTLSVPGLGEELRHEYEHGNGWQSAADISAEELETLRTNALITERVFFAKQFTQLLVATDQPGEPPGVRAEAQRIALGVLRQTGHAASAAQLARTADVSPSAVRALITKGFAAYEEVYVAKPEPVATVGGVEHPYVEQAGTVPEVVTGGVRSYRLAALTPEIVALSENGPCIVLVPENRFVEPAAEQLAASLPPGSVFALADQDQRDAAFTHPPSAARVIVTTFSGLGIPVTLGGLVVTDFQHESYKLLTGSRPWVDEFAVAYATRAAAPVRYSAQLPFGAVIERFPANRTALPLPSLRVHVADMNMTTTWPLHQETQLVLSQSVKRERQALIIAPRRGYSAAYACTECGWRGECPNCSLALKYHDADRRLRCHQCGHDVPAPVACPSCHERTVKPELGAGVERFEQVVKASWPGTEVYRLDSDRRDDIAPLLAGAPGVIITTRGGLRLPPLPGLGLIVFAQFDIIRTVGDYRALDVALNMLYDTAELRAPGSGRPLVVVQTYEPDQEVLDVVTAEQPAVRLHEVSAAQLARRKRLHFPPFAELTRVQLSGRYQAEVEQAADEAVEHLYIAGADNSEVLGPAPAVIPRQRGQFVFQFLLRTTSVERRQELLQALPRRFTGARLTLDIGALNTGDLLF